MEAAVKFAVKNDENFLKQMIMDRWMKMQRSNWASGEEQLAALQSLGVSVSYPTVRDWRNGQLPGSNHQIQLIGAGFKAMLDQAYEPAEMAGALARLEAENELAKKQIIANERESARIRQALQGKLS